jgi:heat shock protein HslJ
MMKHTKSLIFAMALAGMVFGGFIRIASADNDRGFGADVRAEAKINLLGEDRRGASAYDTHDDYNRDDKDRDHDKNDDNSARNPVMHPNNGNHYGFFWRFGDFFRNFFKVKPRPEIVLANPISLQLVAYNGTNVPASEQYVVTLKDGKLSTKFCNTMSGVYTLTNKTVTATLTSTLMYCSDPQNVMTLESAFGRILGEGATITRDANGMIVITGKDNTSFTFRVVASS